MAPLFFYSMIAAVFLGGYIYLMHKHVVSMRLRDINLYSFSFYYGTLIFIIPGALIIVSGTMPDAFYFKATSSAARLLAFFSLLGSYIVFAVATIVLSKVLGKPRIELLRDRSRLQLTPRVQFVLYLTFFLALILFGYSAVLLGSDIPLLHLIQGDIVTASLLRVQNSLTYGNPIYSVLARYFIPFTAIALFIAAKVSRQLRFRLLFVCAFAMAVAFAVHDIEKAPVLELFISLIVAQIFLSGFRARYFAYAAMIFCVAVAAYGVTRSIGLDEMDYLLYRVAYRVFVSQAGGMFLAFKWFPDVIHTPMYFQGLPTFVAELLDIPRYNSAREVMIQMQGSAGDLGVHNSHYIGGAWASWNVLGLLVGPIVVALNYYAFHRLCEYFPRSIYLLAPAFYFSFVMAFDPAADYRAFAYFIMLQVPLLIWVMLIFLKFAHQLLVLAAWRPTEHPLPNTGT